MKNLLRKQFNWLWDAVKGQNENHIISIQDDCAIATDRYRIHVINRDNLPVMIHGINIGSLLNQYIENKIGIKFYINPIFLRDALKGFDSEDQVTIELAKLSEITENIDSLIISSDKTSNEAFIMCMKKEDD